MWDVTSVKMSFEMFWLKAPCEKSHQLKYPVRCFDSKGHVRCYHFTKDSCKMLSVYIRFVWIIVTWLQGYVRGCHLPHGFMWDVVTCLMGSCEMLSLDSRVMWDVAIWLMGHVGYCHLTQGSCEMLPFDSKVVWDVATLLNGHVKCCHYKVKFSSSWYTFIWFIIFFTLNW
jgi:hypothetical protein